MKKKSISKNLNRGIVLAISSMTLVLLLIFVFSIHSLLRERFVESADEEIMQIGGTIEMFLSGIGSTVDFLVDHPFSADVDAVTTNFITKDGHRNGALLAADSTGARLYDLFVRTKKSNSSYLEVYIGNEKGNFILGNKVALPEGYDPRERPWYKDAKKSPEDITVSPVYLSASSEEGKDHSVIVTICKAVQKKGSLSGVVGIDVSLDEITTLLKEMKIGQKGAVALIQGDGTIIANPLAPEMNFIKASKDSATVIHEIRQLNAGETSKVTINGKKYIAYRKKSQIAGTDWELIGFINSEEISKPLIKTTFTVIGITVIFVIVILLISTHQLKRYLIRPLEEVTSFVTTVGEGDFHSTIETTRADEIGDIQKSLGLMVESLKSKTTLTEKIANGDLQERGELISKNDGLGKALHVMVDNLNGILYSMQGMVVQVNSSAEHLAQSSQGLSDGASQQAASLEEISSSINEIQVQTQQNAENATMAQKLSSETKSAAEAGEKQMQEMVNSMKDISDASTEISRIMQVIDDIAFQTNLLALNAAVEAARAGQQGKGFAVVADEVRNLALRSSKASAETSGLISKALDKISYGNELAENTAASFSTIVEKISKSAELVAAISEASGTEKVAMKEIAIGVEQISDVTQGSTASAEETASTSKELSFHANELQDTINQFKLSEG